LRGSYFQGKLREWEIRKGRREREENEETWKGGRDGEGDVMDFGDGRPGQGLRHFIQGSNPPTHPRSPLNTVLI